MKKFLSWLACTLGLYASLQYAWIYFEYLELGEIIATKVDTVVCLIISMIISGILTADC